MALKEVLGTLLNYERAVRLGTKKQSNEISPFQHVGGVSHSSHNFRCAKKGGSYAYAGHVTKDSEAVISQNTEDVIKTEGKKKAFEGKEQPCHHVDSGGGFEVSPRWVRFFRSTCHIFSGCIARVD